jgi:protein-S-isoprenylcysteine O-methyltransferase Ste14
MAYIVAAIFFVFCIVAIIIVVRIYRENRKMSAKQKELFGDDDDIHFRR